MCLHPQARGTSGLPRPRHTAAAHGYPASQFPYATRRHLARKKSTLPVSYGNFPGVVADPSGGASPQREGRGTSGCNLTSPTGVTSRCGGNPIRNARARLATTTHQFGQRKGEPTQMRGPEPNQIQAKRGGGRGRLSEAERLHSNAQSRPREGRTSRGLRAPFRRRQAHRVYAGELAFCPPAGRRGLQSSRHPPRIGQ